MDHVTTARAPLYVVRTVGNVFRAAMDIPEDPVKERLLAGDPDWEEFCRRWAEEYGEP